MSGPNMGFGVSAQRPVAEEDRSGEGGDDSAVMMSLFHSLLFL